MPLGIGEDTDHLQGWPSQPGSSLSASLRAELFRVCTCSMLGPRTQL